MEVVAADGRQPEFVVDLRCDPSALFSSQNRTPFSTNQKAKALGSGCVRRYRRRCARATEQPNEALPFLLGKRTLTNLVASKQASSATGSGQDPPQHGGSWCHCRRSRCGTARGEGGLVAPTSPETSSGCFVLLLRLMSSQSGSHIGAAWTCCCCCCRPAGHASADASPDVAHQRHRRHQRLVLVICRLSVDCLFVWRQVTLSTCRHLHRHVAQIKESKNHMHQFLAVKARVIRWR